jgi:hypothetical protein
MASEMASEIFIVNITVKSFFRYSIQNETDKGYNKKLLELLTLPNEEIFSHWLAGDKIVFCPKHLHPYVEKMYGEIYL